MSGVMSGGVPSRGYPQPLLRESRKRGLGDASDWGGFFWAGEGERWVGRRGSVFSKKPSWLASLLR
jgi:hypothetical protein